MIREDPFFIGDPFLPDPFLPPWLATDHGETRSIR